LAARRAVPIDLDNFEAVMARLAPRLDLALDGADGGRVPWRGESLDDFHPDRLTGCTGPRRSSGRRAGCANGCSTRPASPRPPPS
jgi:hypothetical protein